MTNDEVVRAEQLRKKQLDYWARAGREPSLARRRLAAIAQRFLGSVSQEAILDGERMAREDRAKAEGATPQ